MMTAPVRRLLLLAALLGAENACAEHRSREPTQTNARSLVVWPDTVTLGVGDTLRVRALSRADDDVALQGAGVSWTTSDSTAVAITHGLVTAIGPGWATITATVGGIAGSARVNVAKRTTRE